MRPLVLGLCLIGCASSGAPSASAVRSQFRALTHKGHPSFESPADVASMAPTPDSGGAISTDAWSDCGSCLPR